MRPGRRSKLSSMTDLIKESEKDELEAEMTVINYLGFVRSRRFQHEEKEDVKHRWRRRPERGLVGRDQR